MPLQTDPGLYDEADPSDRSVDASVAVVEDIFNRIPDALAGCAAPRAPPGQEGGADLAHGANMLPPEFNLPPRIQQRPSTNDEGDWDEFVEAWHAQLERWWLRMSVAQRGFFESCSAALGLSLAARLDRVFKLRFWRAAAIILPPPPPLAPADECESVAAAVEEIKVPSFPAVRTELHKLELRRLVPMPKLMPNWPRWQRLNVLSYSALAGVSAEGMAGPSAIPGARSAIPGARSAGNVEGVRGVENSSVVGSHHDENSTGAGDFLWLPFNATALAMGATTGLTLGGLMIAVALRIRLSKRRRCRELGRLDVASDPVVFG